MKNVIRINFHSNFAHFLKYNAAVILKWKLWHKDTLQVGPAVFLNPAPANFRRSRIFVQICKTVRNAILISNNKLCSKSFIMRSCQMQH